MNGWIDGWMEGWMDGWMDGMETKGLVESGVFLILLECFHEQVENLLRRQT